jgi:molybdopterin-guanine dinucleotide biosynthesis protein A
MVRPLGVILAGGSSRRMGTDKALLELGGASFVSWVVSAMKESCEDIVISGRPDGWLGMKGTLDESTDRRGPLAGLATVARSHAGQRLLVVGVDQPWVRAETLRRLAEMGDGLAVVPVDDGVRQTLCALYPAGLADLIDEELAAGGSIQSLLDRIAFEPVTDSQWRTWGEDGRSWYSVDTPEALEQGLTRYSIPA